MSLHKIYRVTKMKKVLAALGVVGFGASAFAEGTITIPTAVDHAALGTAVTTWGSSLIPTLLTVAGCFIGFYLLKFGIRAIKSMASASK